MKDGEQDARVNSSGVLRSDLVIVHTELPVDVYITEYKGPAMKQKKSKTGGKGKKC